MPCRVASIWELIWAQDYKLPVPKRVIYEYATKADADRAEEALSKESGFVNHVTTLKYGPCENNTINGMEYVVTYAGANDTFDRYANKGE